MKYDQDKVRDLLLDIVGLGMVCDPGAPCYEDCIERWQEKVIRKAEALIR